MSIALREPPDLAGGAGGIVARRAVVRWGWRLFRREWRQQLLVLGLLTVAVAATIWGASTVTNVQLPNPNYATFGAAAAQVTLPGTDPHLAADITTIQDRFAAWFAYVPTLQQATGHVVDATNVPWRAFAIGVVFAIATSVLASRRPAKTMAAVPVVAALSGRPAPPKAVHRSALPGVIVFAVGVACLASTGGWNGGGGGSHALLLLAGLVATIVGILLLAPLSVSVLAAGAGPRLPVAIRIALRDLVRYRARSGAALAAATFAVFLAMVICLVASIQFGNPLNWFGSNLSSSQLIIYTQQHQSAGEANQLSNAQLASLGRQVDSYAAGLHARSVLPLEMAGPTLYQVGTQGPHDHFNGNVYLATPQLLAAYGIKASQIRPGTDILTMRPGLAALPHMEMTWGSYGFQYGPGGLVQKARVLPSCTLSNDCVANPAIQTVSSLPGGTSAPNTVTTEYVVSKYHLQTQLFGWLIQAPAPLTAMQISAARHLALAYEVMVETNTDAPSLGEFAGGATALGIVIALGVLAASVGYRRACTQGTLLLGRARPGELTFQTACGLSTAPTKRPEVNITTGQNGCAARDSNPEPAD